MPTACKCECGLDSPHPLVKKIFQWCVEHNYIVSSVCRCIKHNAAEGGTSRSQHLPQKDGLCRAIDVHHRLDDPLFEKMLKGADADFHLNYSWGTHIDFRRH